jgi:hypothetical protein
MHRSAALVLTACIAAVPAAAQESVRPLPRPEEVGRPAETGSVAVCNRPDIIGERLPRVDDPGACGVVRPVRLDEVAGVALEPAPVVTCRTARRLRRWLVESVKPAFGSGEDSLVGLGIAAGYVCRTINYAEDADISEHGKGRALDIARFERAGGETVSVLEHWDGEQHGELLRGIHADACGIFGTAIGPESDPLHEDHFHYDVEERRRPYCP